MIPYDDFRAIVLFVFASVFLFKRIYDQADFDGYKICKKVVARVSLESKDKYDIPSKRFLDIGF